MRVLWLVSTAANYQAHKRHLYNGCGWIVSLEDNLKKNEGIELAQAFFVRSNEPSKTVIDGVAYYPIKDPYASKAKVLASLFVSPRKIDERKLRLINQVINDYKPDVIQVFGSEDVFGVISKYTQVPVLIHIQGIINPYLSSFLPPFMSWKQYPGIAIKLRQRLLRQFDRKDWNYRAEREKEIIRLNKFFIGRTDWDERITKLYNANAHYFKCWEILRGPFYDNNTVRILPSRLTLVTTISNASYKGFDMILKTADILKNVLDIDFEWNVYGAINAIFYEKIYKLKAEKLNICLKGVGTPQNIADSIMHASVYMHPSYIDNSPNSVCEAMILGCPVVACNVGGVSTLIEHGETGFLVPSNDPFQAAFFIRMLHSDIELNKKMGYSAKMVASKRHNIETICETMMEIYRNVK